MKKVSLVMLGLAFAFAGLQSFVKDDVRSSEKTVLTTVDENWSNNNAEGTGEVMPPPYDWRVTPCTTPQGLSGTTCSWSSQTQYAVCFNPRNQKFLCVGNSSS